MHMNLNKLIIHKVYSKIELSKIFEYGFNRNGICTKIINKNQKIIIIFSDINSPYSDKMEGDIFTYYGEGPDISKNQKFTRGNKNLGLSNLNNNIIYGFRKEDSKSTLWTYIGILKVIDYDYISQNGRMVYEFKIQKTEIESEKELEKEQQVLYQELDSAPILIEERKTKQTFTKIKIRSAAFKTEVKKVYEDTCVVCEKRRYTKAKFPEVQAAHIFPVEREGSDDLRNGISLCRLHHWAFDGGLFVITDNFKIKVREEIKNDSNYEEIYSFDKKTIKLPQNPKLYPAEIYLKAHREIHGF
jgi:putative restriction endonuclease